MLFGIGQRVARSRHLRAVLEALQIVPAALHLHRTPQLGGHPVGYRPTAPMLGPIGRRACQRRPQLLLLSGREHARRAPRGRVLPVDHARGPFDVVALGDLANPGAVVAGALGNRRGGLAPSQQPENLPPTPLMRLMGGAVALFEVLDAQVRRQMNMSAHTFIV